MCPTLQLSPHHRVLKIVCFILVKFNRASLVTAFSFQERDLHSLICFLLSLNYLAYLKQKNYLLLLQMSGFQLDCSIILYLWSFFKYDYFSSIPNTMYSRIWKISDFKYWLRGSMNPDSMAQEWALELYRIWNPENPSWLQFTLKVFSQCHFSVPGLKCSTQEHYQTLQNNVILYVCSSLPFCYEHCRS